MPFASNRRMIIKNGIGAATALQFLKVRSVFAQSAPDDTYLRFVHPELRAEAAHLLKTPTPTQNPPNQAALVALRGRPSPPPPGNIPWQKRTIPGLRGQPEVTIYVVNAKAGEARPAVLHTHGGGYLIGSAVADLPGVQDTCRELGCVAVNVEYRLAPETTYAGSVEDNYAALKWLYEHADELGVDRARIAVIGRSAGGGHAALLAIAARDRGEIELAFQCLLYAMLDDRTGTTRQVPAHVGKLAWTAESNRFGWQGFLGMAPGGPDVPARAVPARVLNLAGLPPAFIGVGSIDLFHDENVDYAQRLNAAGVATELIVIPGMYHGAGAFGGSASILRWFRASWLDALRRGLGIPLDS